MNKGIKILLWILVPIFLVLFISSAFVDNLYLRIAEYIVDAILLVIIGIELFGKKKDGKDTKNSNDE